MKRQLIKFLAPAFVVAAFLALAAPAWGATGQVWEWGYVSNMHHDQPVQVDLTGADTLSAGRHGSMAVKNDGTLWTWGYNFYGVLCNGESDVRYETPVQVSGVPNVKDVAVGQVHSLILKEDGTVWACGDNSHGALGNGSAQSSSTPVQVSGLTNIKAIAAGGHHNSLALEEDGTVWHWGVTDGFDADKNGHFDYSTTPIQAMSNGQDVSAGNQHNVVVKTDGTVWTWGHDSLGQFGDGACTNDRRSMMPVQSDITGVKSIEAGSQYNLALKEDGTVWAWGEGRYGALGDGTTALKSCTPVQAKDLTGVKAIATGHHSNHSLALKENGTVWAWGRWALGHGISHSNPVPVQTNIEGASAIATGSSWSLAIADDTNPPTVESITPTNGSTGVDVRPQVEINFSEAIDRDTLTASTFTLTGEGASRQPCYFRSYDAVERKAKLGFCGELEQGATYAITLKGGNKGVKDRAGNHMLQDVVARFTTVDNTPPDTTIIGGPANGSTTTSASANFSFSSNEQNPTFECSLDDATFSDCNPEDNSLTTKSYDNLSFGSRTFKVRAKDAAGNLDPTPATRTWTVQQAPDTTQPTISLTAPNDGAIVDGTGVSLSADASDNVGVAKVEFLVNGNVVATDASAPYSASWDSENVPDGRKTVTARAFDAAGNQKTSASREVVVDNFFPNSTITGGPAEGSLSGVASATFRFSSSDPDGEGFLCKLDDRQVESCSSGKSYPSLSQGRHTFTVRAIGSAGEEIDTEPSPATRTWTVDSVKPGGTVRINGNKATTTSRAVRLNLAAVDPAPGSGGIQVRLSNNGRSWSGWQSYTPTKRWTLAAGKAGNRVVHVQYKDRAGNVSAAARDTIKYVVKKKRR